MNYTDKSLLNSVGLSYGELSLKGKNRGQFERMLRNRIHKSLNGFNHELVDDLSKLYVIVDNNDMDEVVEKLKKIFGVVGLNPSARVNKMKKSRQRYWNLQIMPMNRERGLLK